MIVTLSSFPLPVVRIREIAVDGNKNVTITKETRIAEGQAEVDIETLPAIVDLIDVEEGLDKSIFLLFPENATFDDLNRVWAGIPNADRPDFELADAIYDNAPQAAMPFDDARDNAPTVNLLSFFQEHGYDRAHVEARLPLRFI